MVIRLTECQSAPEMGGNMHIPKIDLTGSVTRALMALTDVNEMHMYLKQVTIHPAEVEEGLGWTVLPPDANTYGYDAKVTLKVKGMANVARIGLGIIPFKASIRLVRCDELGGWFPNGAEVDFSERTPQRELWRWSEDGHPSCMPM